MIQYITLADVLHRTMRQQGTTYYKKNLYKRTNVVKIE